MMKIDYRNQSSSFLVYENVNIIKMLKRKDGLNMKPEIRSDISEKLESAFLDIKKGNNIQGNIKIIQDTLRQTFHKQFTVKIVNPKPSQAFFVMSISPDISTLQRMIEAIVMQNDDLSLKAVWDQCNEWTIEIDKRIFDEKVINLSKDEMVALLLHEIGHVVYSNSIPQRISRVIKFEYAKTSMIVKNLMRSYMFSKVLSIPILDGCGFNVSDSRSSLNTEIKADGFSAKMGYRDALVSALNKFSEMNSIDKMNPDDRMKKLTQFSFETIQQFQKRQTALTKSNMIRLISGCPSEYVKNTLCDIYKGFFSESALSEYTGERCVTVMNESEKLNHVFKKIDQVTDDFYATEFFLLGKKKLKKIDPATIDYIDVEKANIRTNDDKMLLISYIYSKLETVEFYLSILNNQKSSKKYDVPHTKSQLIYMRDRLQQLRDEVIAYKIPEVRYGIQINYPSGYEG